MTSVPSAASSDQPTAAVTPNASCRPNLAPIGDWAPSPADERTAMAIARTVPADGAQPETGSIEVIEISTEVIRNSKETIWLLLNHALHNDANIFVDIGTRLLPAERLKIYEKLVLFSLPTLVLPERAATDKELPRLLLRSGTQQIELPIKFALENTSSTTAPLGSTSGTMISQDVQLSSLFEFATEGDPLALLKPLIPLLALTDSDGCNVLHLAARNKQNFALKMLLSALRSPIANDNDSSSSSSSSSSSTMQVIVNARNLRGQTPLHCAVRAGDADCVHYLVAAGAQNNIGDNHANTVVHYLGDVYNDAIYKDILETSASEIERATDDEQTTGAAANHLAQKNGDGQTPAHIAVRKLKLGLLEALAEAGAPLDIADQNTETPLINALTIDDTEAASFLIQHNCDVNAITSSGDTPLSIACKKKNLIVIGRLLDAGANQHYVGDHDENRWDAALDEDIQRILNGERVEIVETLDGNNGYGNNEDDEDGAEFYGSSSTATSNYTAASNHQLRSFPKDDIACVDYLTRLRLSKLLDAEDKWATLAERLDCGHMVQYIRVCLDGTSSPTMIFLDQYEQIAGANVSSVAQSLEEMGEEVGARLLRAC